MMNVCSKGHPIRMLLVCVMLAAGSSARASVFTPVTTGPEVMDRGIGGACAWADAAKNGYPDIFVQSGFQAVIPNRLYQNLGDGNFLTTDFQSRDGNTGVLWGDFDNDGYPDLIQTFLGIFGGVVLEINGGPSLDLIPYYPAFAHPAAADFDNDGWLDFAASGSWWWPDTLVLMRNLGLGEFDPIHLAESGPAQGFLPFSPVWGDLDNDGLPDLFVLVQGASSLLFRNNGDGTFNQITNSVLSADGFHAVFATWGDYNNDGFLDLFLANGGGVPNSLYRNGGDGTFAAVGGVIAREGGRSVVGAWADYDNDGNLDLFVTNQGEQNFLYHNNGDESFTRVETPELYNASTNSVSAAWADFDSDGFADLFVSNSSSGWMLGTNSLFHNNGNSNHWIKVLLQAKTSNRSAIGAKVRVKATIGGREVWQLREISGGNGQSQNDLIAHFGLGDAASVEAIRVEWPSGSFQEIRDQPIDRALTVDEPGFVTLPTPQQLSLLPGTNLTLTAQLTSPGPCELQWRFNNKPINGATTAELTITNLQAEQAGLYSVTAKEADTSTVSGSTTTRVSLIPGPVITSQPADQSVSLNAAVLFQVSATSTIPITYQWRKDGQTLAGQNDLVLSIPGAVVADAGRYSVEVRTAAGTVISREAELVVDRSFSKLTPPGLINPGSSSDCAWGDYNNDGWVDLLVANSGGNNYLFHNLGNGTFERLTPALLESPVPTTGGAWADFDNDGFPDLALTRAVDNSPSVLLLRGLGDGTFVSTAAGDLAIDRGTSWNPAWADENNDGLVDLFVCAFPQNPLYRNLGQGSFNRISGALFEDSLAQASGAAWGDANNDGKLDLIIASEDRIALFESRPGALELQLSDPFFPDGLPQARGAAWGDYDNDGRLDVCVAGAGRNLLFHNEGEGRFIQISTGEISGSSGHFLSCAWGDYDNDGWLDLFVVNGNGLGNLLFHNGADGTFEKITTGSLVNDQAGSAGAAWADYDNDGFVDLYVANGGNNYSGGTVDFFYRNSGNSNKWLNVKLVGKASNRAAIGAKVRIKATVHGKALWQLREVSGGGSGGQNDLRAAFGLGDSLVAETLRIEWPSGIVQELQNVVANQFLTLEEPAACLDLIRRQSGEFVGRLVGRVQVSHELQESTDLVTWRPMAILANPTGKAEFHVTPDPSPGGHFFRSVERAIAP